MHLRSIESWVRDLSVSSPSETNHFKGEMMNKFFEFILTIVVAMAIYLPFHRKVNSGNRPWKRFDTAIGWGMFTILAGCIGYIVYASNNPHNWLFLDIALASISGISLSIWSSPYGDRVLSLPYKLARWIAILGILWAIGDVLHLY